jgi:hypothetical protein
LAGYRSELDHVDGEDISELLGSDVGVGIVESENVHVLVVVEPAFECGSESDIAESFLGFLAAKLGLQLVHGALMLVLVKLAPVFELGHGLTPVNVLLVEVGWDLDPVVNLLLSLVVLVVEELLSGREDGGLPSLVEMRILELVEQVHLDLAKCPVMGLPMVFIIRAVTIIVRRAILIWGVRVLHVGFVVSDPPEPSAVLEILILWLVTIMHGVSEGFVPEAMVLFIFRFRA